MPDVLPLEVFYTTQAQADLEYWSRADPQIRKRIDRLVADILLHPFTGLGKPEPLRHQLAGYWSRRITAEHRLVYRVAGTTVFIAQCRFHY